MERLTVPDKPIEGGIRRAIIDTRAVKEDAMKFYWTLKKYEDTGLTPEEIIDGKLLTGWIPVTERMPEAAELEAYGDEVTPVLITYLGYYDREPNADALAIWCEDNAWRWYDDALHVNIMDVVKVEITAWMPLPESYRPE